MNSGSPIGPWNNLMIYADVSNHNKGRDADRCRYLATVIAPSTSSS